MSATAILETNPGPLLEGEVEPRSDLPLSAQAKWGIGLNGGFQIIPDLLLRYQAPLDLTTNDLVVLLHLTMAWWDVDRPPFPRAATIARRIGVSERTVQRSLSRLLKKKLFRKTKVRSNTDEWRQGFDLTPLAVKLKEIAETDIIAVRRRLLRNERAGVQNQPLAQAQ